MRDSLPRGHRVRSINLRLDYLSGCNRSLVGPRASAGARARPRVYEADVQREALELRDAAGVKDQLTDREPARRIVSVRRGRRLGNS